jgi:hypothetical protein
MRIEDIRTVKKGIKISDVQPVKPLIIFNKPGKRQQTNRNTSDSNVYPDSFFIDSQVFNGEKRIPLTLCLNFAK